MPEITEKELPANLKPIWLKALTAVQTSNLEFAINLLQSILKDNPGFLEGRKILRKCELQIAGNTKKKGGLFGMQSGGMGVMKLVGQAKKDPAGTLPLIEKELEKDPLSAAANDLLFDTLLKLELFESAAFALETVRKGTPENAKLLHKLAEFYITRDQPLIASEVYNDIIKHHPTDGPAIKGSKDASARASMQKQKWDENADMRSLMKNTAEFEELEKASRTGLTREQLEERRDKVVEKYNLDPNHLATVKDLANLYEQLEDWHNSHTFYSWAHSLSNGDVALATKAAAMKDKALETDMKQLEVAAAADPDNEELKAALDARKADRIAEQVVEAQKRVDQNPTDPQLRFELGTALYKSGDHSAAIPHLQQATRNPHIRTKVLLLLARTFRAKGMFDLAIKQLSDALADLIAMDNTKKEVLYEKGLIHTEMGDKESALDCFKQIYEVDYGYLDVAKRVESSYS
ncbi:MAG: tetratricopeptide repeat protein [Luteolibacter sp.]|uniref:tetratricopeptide repeat protein n=1 Tax=Luteolibacter sp. TaxID=1962973 RepID=UPI003267B4DC